ncbi:hypothetical protein NBRC116587_16050 [Pseudoteredinibacter isoporae]
MLVVSIIATLSWLTVIAIPDGQQARVENAAQQFRLQLESHRRTASMKGQMLAVDFLEEAYQFLIWDYRQREWLAFEQASNLGVDSPSGKVSLGQRVELQIEQGLDFGESTFADRLANHIEEESESLEPKWQADILIFPDGRISQFSVIFGSEKSELSVRVLGRAYGKVKVQNLL